VYSSVWPASSFDRIEDRLPLDDDATQARRSSPERDPRLDARVIDPNGLDPPRAWKLAGKLPSNPIVLGSAKLSMWSATGISTDSPPTVTESVAV
jgi:hypothetical protein